jgi:RNA polymerase sigma-70 factor (ECF subfamily)
MAKAAHSGQTLERFRGFLLLLAQQHWDSKLQSRLDPADLVQQTLMEAYKVLDQFHGTTEAEMAGWLRKILARNLAQAYRDHGRAKRDYNLERSLEQALEESSSRLQAWLAADQSTPSERAVKNERLTQLADALAQLPSDQREAVTLHHLRGLSLVELARHLERTEASVAGLLRRGLKRLRELLGDPE